MDKVLIIMITLFLVSCQFKEVEQQIYPQDIKLKKDSIEINIEEDIECKYSQNIDNYLDEIINTPKKNH
jgi:hypothetical protein